MGRAVGLHGHRTCMHIFLRFILAELVTVLISVRVYRCNCKSIAICTSFCCIKAKGNHADAQGQRASRLNSSHTRPTALGFTQSFSQDFLLQHFLKSWKQFCAFLSLHTYFTIFFLSQQPSCQVVGCLLQVSLKTSSRFLLLRLIHTRAFSKRGIYNLVASFAVRSCVSCCIPVVKVNFPLLAFSFVHLNISMLNPINRTLARMLLLATSAFCIPSHKTSYSKHSTSRP